MVRKGFTLIELMVTTVVVGVGLAGVMAGIRAIGVADVKARTADTLQQLAAQKLAEVRTSSDIANASTSGDFSDQGYSDINYQVDVQPSGTDNIDEVKVTVTQNNDTQTLTEFLFVPPTTTTTTTTATPTTTGRGVRRP